MKLGETLVKSGLINEEQLKRVLLNQQKSNERLGEIVLRMGFATAEQMAPILAKYFDIPYVNVKQIYKNIKPEVIDSLPLELAQRFTILPIEFKKERLVVAMSDPLDFIAIDTVQLKISRRILPSLAIENEINDAIEYCYHHLPRLKESVENFVDTSFDAKEEAEGASQQQFDASDKPVVQYVKSLISQAVNSHASDILIDPKEDNVELRFRVDGFLHQVDPPPKPMLGAINARIKILSGLDIAERRLPQDGRFKVKIGKSDIDIRTSTFPTIYGESVVLRLLDTAQPMLGLGQLGFEKNDLEKFRSLLSEPYGLILVTGPTGSGKTTTLYTCLNEIKTASKNICTLEDPVEYRLPFIKQSQVNQMIGFTFSRGLRSLLRQDPDVIMVGEIRDKETAEISIHAALTGHLVLSTLHTNDAVGAPIRLINMGIEPYLIASSLLGIVAQRLVRVNCPDCSRTYDRQSGNWEALPFSSEIERFSKGAGCPKCLQSGYKGRQGIFEVLVPDEEVLNCIMSRGTSDAIRFIAQKKGMKSLHEAGIEKLRAGVTSPEEILRVTQRRREI
ncbi:MAG: Flp pilus assembly complex ATPase component TadA [Candidatus Omnitrophica bacterium]|nr:Flp pilus assembly complex ATPase component TadA [Candidatus Omnitrophota bacterium]